MNKKKVIFIIILLINLFNFNIIFAESSIVYIDTININIKDEIDVLTGKYSRYISDKVVLDGSLNWESAWTGSGWKSARITNYFTDNIINRPTTIIKFDGKQLTQVLNISKVDQFWVQPSSSSYMFAFTIANIDSGFSESMTPSSNEIKAFLFGWKMCNSDGSTPYLSGQKYWKKIIDGTGLTSVLPVSSYTGFKPYEMYYKLVNPIITTNYDQSSLIVINSLKNNVSYSNSILIVQLYMIMGFFVLILIKIYWGRRHD